MDENNGDKFLLKIKRYFLASGVLASGVGTTVVLCPTARELFRVVLDKDVHR